MPRPVDSVNLKAFCTAFEVIGKDRADEICNALHADWENAGDDVSIYYEGKGAVWAPQYGDILSRRQISQWNRLALNSEELTQKGFSPEIVGYFIAGAFGLNALPFDTLSSDSQYRKDPWGRETKKVAFYREDADPRLVEGLNHLYGLTLKKGPDALESGAAKKVEQNWKNWEGCKATEDKSDRLDCVLKELVSRYEWLEEKIKDSRLRDIYEGYATPYKDVITKEKAEDDEGMQEKIVAARTLVKLAMRHQIGEESRENRFKLLGLENKYDRLEGEIRRDKKATATLTTEVTRITRKNGRGKSVESKVKIMEAKIKVAEEILETLRERSEKPEIDSTSKPEEDSTL